MIARRADDDPIGTAQGIDQRSGLRRALFDIWRIHGHVERCAVEHNGFRALLRALVQHLPQYHFRSEEHTSELQSLMRISYAVFCLKKKKKTNNRNKIKRRHRFTYIIQHTSTR